MKVLFKLFIVFFVVCFIVACEQTMFGVPIEQWNTLSKVQQQEVIRGYNQRKQIEKQNEPIMSAIGATEGIVRQQQYLDRSRHHHYRPTPRPFPPHPHF